MTETKQSRKNYLTDKAEELEEQAESLEEKAGKIRELVERCYDSEDIPKHFKGNSNDYNRLVLNNERVLMGDAPELTRRVLDDSELSFTEAYNVIIDFAKSGDSLCQLLKHGHYFYRDIVLEGFWTPDIAKKLLSRKGMTETEYSGYVETLTKRIEKLQGEQEYVSDLKSKCRLDEGQASPL